MMIGVKGKQLCAGNPNAAGQTDGQTDMVIPVYPHYFVAGGTTISRQFNKIQSLGHTSTHTRIYTSKFGENPYTNKEIMSNLNSQLGFRLTQTRTTTFSRSQTDHVTENTTGISLWIYRHFLRKKRYFNTLLLRYQDSSSQIHKFLQSHHSTYFQKYFLIIFCILHQLIIVALRSAINTESVPKVSWRKIWSISGFMVSFNYTVTSRQL